MTKRADKVLILMVCQDVMRDKRKNAHHFVAQLISNRTVP